VLTLLRPAIAIGLFVAFGGVLYGYDTGTISGILAMPYWLQEFSTEANGEITPAQDSLIVSILSAGTFFGALCAAPVADFLGRRIGLMASAGLVFNLGVILQTASTAQPMFIAGRFFAGLGVGLISAMIPMYQSETAPKWIRGVIVGSYQLAITIGLFLAAIVNNSTKDRNDSGSYRIPIAVQFLWSLILVIGLFILPETPRYLIKMDRYEKVCSTLAVLRDNTHTFGRLPKLFHGSASCPLRIPPLPKSLVRSRPTTSTSSAWARDPTSTASRAP